MITPPEARPTPAIQPPSMQQVLFLNLYIICTFYRPNRASNSNISQNRTKIQSQIWAKLD